MRLVVKSFLLAALVVASTLRAACPYPKFTPSSAIQLGADSAFFVTHASREFDGKAVSKGGIDAMVAAAKARRVPVVYLHEPEVSKNALYFYGDCHPTYYVLSYGGEFDFRVTPRNILTAGGFLENCKERNVQHVLRAWSAQGERRDLRITEIMAGSYQLQGLMTGSESYYSGYRKYVDTTGSWAITLLDLLRIVKDRPAQLDYVYRYLNRNAGFMPTGHRIVVAWDGVEQWVYRDRSGPTLTFDFVTSPEAALAYADAP